MGKPMDLTGQRYGQLQVLEQAPNLGRDRAWACCCDCGAVTVVRASHLRSGHTTSCGCFRIEQTIAATKTHGLTGTPLHNCWKGVWKRCGNPKQLGYENYGGRGITVDPAWRSFERFRQDMEPGCEPGLQIDRIDVNGPYCKANCRWVTRVEQQRNKRNNRIITVAGFTGCVTAAAEQFNLPESCLRDRLRRGWAPEDAVLAPVGTSGRNQALHTEEGAAQ